MEGLELSLQLPQGKRKAELRSDEEGLDEKDDAEKDHNPGNEQAEAKARPAFASRIGKNKRGHRMRRDFFHVGG